MATINADNGKSLGTGEVEGRYLELPKCLICEGWHSPLVACKPHESPQLNPPSH